MRTQYNFMQLINRYTEVEMEAFYKTFIIKKGNNNYNDTKKYFEKYGTNSQFENCWAYTQYIKWKNSDTYMIDFNAIKKEYIDDIISGFNSIYEELIFMEDDEEIKNKYINILDKYNSIKTIDNKLEYLSELYERDLYYPNFSHSWLYNYYEDKIII